MSDVAAQIRMMPPDEQQLFVIWLAVHRPAAVRDGLRAWRLTHDAKPLADLRGVAVYRYDNDRPCPRSGFILDRAGIQGDEYVWVIWDGDAESPAPAREALDELTPASRQPW